MYVKLELQVLDTGRDNPAPAVDDVAFVFVAAGGGPEDVQLVHRYAVVEAVERSVDENHRFVGSEFRHLVALLQRDEDDDVVGVLVYAQMQVLAYHASGLAG